MKYRVLDMLADPIGGCRLHGTEATVRLATVHADVSRGMLRDFCGRNNATVSTAAVIVSDCVACYKEEVVSGTLVSDSGREYKIVNGIPRLLSSDTIGWVRKNQDTFSLEWKMFRFGERN